MAAFIERLEGRNEEQVMRAAHALIGMGPRVIRPLSESLKSKRGCVFRFVASGVIYAIDKREEAANPVLIEVALGRCEGSSQNDLAVRRHAALSLVTRAEGVAAVARMLQDRETFIRRSAAFAFDELTEKLAGARPDSIEATPEMVAALKGALPLLAAALADRDEVVRCMSLEALEQVTNGPSADVREEAARLLKGAKPRCSS